MDARYSKGNWLKNARGEWFVVGQVVLLAAVLLAPRLDSQGFFQFLITGIAGSLLCVIGLGFIVLGTVALGRTNLSPFPKPKEEGTLVESGMFSIVRHPIYTGFIFATLGWSLLWSSVAALFAMIALLVFFDIKARREERWLEAKFGNYAAYKSRVRKLIPFIY